MREIISWDLSTEKDDHHVKCTIVTMELSCGLHQSFPVLWILVNVVLVHLSIDLLQFWVKTHYELLELSHISYLISDSYELLLCLFENQVGKK